MLACGPEQGAILCPGTIPLGTVDARAVLQATVARPSDFTERIQEFIAEPREPQGCGLY